jgi:riboflavin biosynthesis pyrimidine reductase
MKTMRFAFHQGRSYILIIVDSRQEAPLNYEIFSAGNHWRINHGDHQNDSQGVES